MAALPELQVSLKRQDSPEENYTLPTCDVLELSKLWNSETEVGYIDLGNDRLVAVSSIHDLSTYALLDLKKPVKSLKANEKLKVVVKAGREAQNSFRLSSVVGNDFRSIQKVNLHGTEKGYSIYIYGPNNSGKTSFLNMIRLWHLCFRNWHASGCSHKFTITPLELQAISFAYSIDNIFHRQPGQQARSAVNISLSFSDFKVKFTVSQSSDHLEVTTAKRQTPFPAELIVTYIPSDIQFRTYRGSETMSKESIQETFSYDNQVICIISVILKLEETGALKLLSHQMSRLFPFLDHKSDEPAILVETTAVGISVQIRYKGTSESAPSKVVPINEEGSGFKRILFILSCILLNDHLATTGPIPSPYKHLVHLVLMDEPSTLLYPTLESSFAAVVSSTILALSTPTRPRIANLVISTHSSIILSSAKGHVLTLDSMGKALLLNAKPFFSTLPELIPNPTQAMVLAHTPLIILHEGKDDENLLTERSTLLERFKNTGQLGFWGTGGRKTAEEYISMLKELKTLGTLLSRSFLIITDSDYHSKDYLKKESHKLLDHGCYWLNWDSQEMENLYFEEFFPDGRPFTFNSLSLQVSSLLDRMESAHEQDTADLIANCADSLEEFLVRLHPHSGRKSYTVVKDESSTTKKKFRYPFKETVEQILVALNPLLSRTAATHNRAELLPKIMVLLRDYATAITKIEKQILWRDYQRWMVQVSADSKDLMGPSYFPEDMRLDLPVGGMMQEDGYWRNFDVKLTFPVATSIAASDLHLGRSFRNTLQKIEEWVQNHIV